MFSKSFKPNPEPVHGTGGNVLRGQGSPLCGHCRDLESTHLLLREQVLQTHNLSFEIPDPENSEN